MPNLLRAQARARFAPLHRRSFLATLTVTGTMLGAAVRAQCTTQWLPGDGLPGTNGSVSATTLWDPDGPGPATPRLVAGGYFTMAGTTMASHIAAYDLGSGSWSTLGSGLGSGWNSQTPWVNDLTTLANGDLVVGGDFSSVGGVSAGCIARWNGSQWSALGAGVTGGTWRQIFALTTLPNGDLIVGGNFTSVGGVSASCVARWDGSLWSALGTGVNGPVLSLATLPNGDLVAGGDFTLAGGVSANSIARWNGSQWSPLGTGMAGAAGAVDALTTLPNGDLIAAGSFTSAGGVSANRIARWDGTAWSALGSGMNQYGVVIALATLPNGELVAGGNFTTAGGISANFIARWNGSQWSALGSGMAGANASVDTLTVLPNGDLMAGGAFTSAGSSNANYLARWNGSLWSALGSGMNGDVQALLTLPNGDLIAGGWFTTAGTVTANHVARWNGSTWSALGSGTSGGTYGGAVYALAMLPNGDLVAGGDFTFAGGVAANHVARWNGSSWSALGGWNAKVEALVTLPNGTLVAGGAFGVARWNGSQWSGLGSGFNNAVLALTSLPNGELAAGGLFTAIGAVGANCIARWNGSSWSPLGSGMTGGNGYSFVTALATSPNGDLVAGGEFTIAGGVSANHIANWNGTSWSALGSGMNSRVRSFATLPSGDLVAGGEFNGGAGTNFIARWNGSAWSGLAGGTSWPVLALATLSNGDLAAGGSFFPFANGPITAFFARLTTTCPATAMSFGAGCPSAAGPMVLSATALPWVGGTCRSSCSGFANGALGFAMLGFTSPNTPLGQLHPAGGPGCTLLATPDAMQWLPPTNGIATWQLAIPMGTAFVGVQLRHQVLQLELDPTLQITGLYSSNGLLLTIGAF